VPLKSGQQRIQQKQLDSRCRRPKRAAALAEQGWDYKRERLKAKKTRALWAHQDSRAVKGTTGTLG